MGEWIPDAALVVRGGRNLPEDLRRGAGNHPSGVRGVSVECSAEVPLETLAAAIPHSRIGRTTVAAIRTVGGERGADFGTKPVSCHVGRSQSRRSEPAAYADVCQSGKDGLTKGNYYGKPKSLCRLSQRRFPWPSAAELRAQSKTSHNSTSSCARACS